MARRSKELKPNFSIRRPHMRSGLIGAILIAIGAILLINPTPLNIKISFASVLIGLFSIILISDKTDLSAATNSKKKIKKKSTKKVKNVEKQGIFNNINLNLSEKITLIIAIWILFLLIISGSVNMEAFFVSIFIGILVLKEITDEYTSKHQKYDMNIFIFAFLIVFIAIMGKKIISISSI